MKILFPTDFSTNSEVAFNYAIDFIKKVNGKLTLLHVSEAANMESVGVGSMASFSSGPSGRLQEKVKRDERNVIQKKLVEMANNFGLSESQYDIISTQGNIKAEIDKVLTAQKYDFVILGTRSKDSQRGLFFGGIANHLIVTAKCPVLVIPPKAIYKDIKRIVYTTDLIHQEKGVLLWLINYAKLYNATLHLLHVGNDENVRKKHIVQNLIKELPYDNITYEIIPGKNISTVILEITNKGDVDIISMTTHSASLFQRIFHSSFTADVLEKVDIPLIGFSDNDVIPHSFE